MPDYKVDQKVKYATTHEWVRIEGDLAVVGISDAAQDMLSDVVYVDLPKVGTVVTAGKQAAAVESVKAAEDVIAPVSGTVVEVNAALESTPEAVNQDPYAAWFFKVRPTQALEGELDTLMSASEYEAFVAESAH
jgi:glycine cleavage system H protein